MTEAAHDAHDDGVEEQVTRALADRGLTGPGFELDVVVADIRSRLDVDASLDVLIGPGEPG